LPSELASGDVTEDATPFTVELRLLLLSTLFNVLTRGVVIDVTRLVRSFPIGKLVLNRGPVVPVPLELALEIGSVVVRVVSSDPFDRGVRTELVVAVADVPPVEGEDSGSREDVNEGADDNPRRLGTHRSSRHSTESLADMRGRRDFRARAFMRAVLPEDQSLARVGYNHRYRAFHRSRQSGLGAGGNLR